MSKPLGSNVPLRPLLNEGAVSSFYSHETVVVKSTSDLHRQRMADGTPITATGPSALRPAGPHVDLYLDGVPMKKSKTAEEERAELDELIRKGMDLAGGIVREYLLQRGCQNFPIK